MNTCIDNPHTCALVYVKVLVITDSILYSWVVMTWSITAHVNFQID